MTEVVKVPLQGHDNGLGSGPAARFQYVDRNPRRRDVPAALKRVGTVHCQNAKPRTRGTGNRDGIRLCLCGRRKEPDNQSGKDDGKNQTGVHSVLFRVASQAVLRRRRNRCLGGVWVEIGPQGLPTTAGGVR